MRFEKLINNYSVDSAAVHLVCVPLKRQPCTLDSSWPVNQHAKMTVSHNNFRPRPRHICFSRNEVIKKKNYSSFFFFPNFSRNPGRKDLQEAQTWESTSQRDLHRFPRVLCCPTINCKRQSYLKVKPFGCGSGMQTQTPRANKKESTVPLVSRLRIWQRHLKETAIILPPCSLAKWTQGSALVAAAAASSSMWIPCAHTRRKVVPVGSDTA